MFGRIPMPRLSGEILNEGADTIINQLLNRQKLAQSQEQLNMQKQQLPLQLELLKAQTYQHQQAAKKAEEEQNLYRQLFGASDLNQTKNNNQLPKQPQQNLNASQEPTQKQLSGIPNNISEMHNQLQSGQEVIIKGADSPQKELWDRVPGTTVMGIKIPDVKSNVVDGIRYDRYPSGKIVAQKVGPNTEEKAEIALNAAERKEQAKANIKRSEDIKATMKMLQDYSHHVESLHELLEKNKNVSGLLSGYKTKFKAGSPEAAIFQSHATPMVGTLAKNISQRGGAVAAGIAQAGKPDIFQPHSYNVSMVNEQAKGVYTTYKNAKDEWEQLHPGKEFPYKLPKFYDKVRVRAPNGLTYIKTQEQADNLVKKYPGSEILGNIYEQ